MLSPEFTFDTADSHYELVRVLNSGGFGTAYVAKRTHLGITTEVVVKTPQPQVLADPVWSKKFAREARILANIHHPNVVRIIAFAELPTGEKLLVQELVNGAQNLATYVAAKPDEAPSLFLQALYGLMSFHDSLFGPAVVHRDLSPANLLIDAQGVLKVIDFGLAKEDPRVTEVLTVAGQWFGTAGCMAPEQAQDSASVDHRADLFALGRSFAAALQQRNPLYADPSLLPAPWNAIVSKLTAHDPPDRYQSAEEAMEDALRKFHEAGLVLHHFPLHVEQLLGRCPPAWASYCRSYFVHLPIISIFHVALASRLADPVLADSSFDANAFFVRARPAPS